MGFLTETFRRSAISYRAATPENPRFSLNDPAAWDAFGATPSAAGIPINNEIALTYSPWWRGVNLVSNDVAKLPLYVYKRVGADDPDGLGRGKLLARAHASFRLLHRQPNARMNAFEWKRLMVSHAMSTGNGYSVIRRLGDGSPDELLPLDPGATYPVLKDGELWYITELPNPNNVAGKKTMAGQQRRIRGEDVFHLHGLGYDGLQGYSVWQKARDDLGLGKGAKRFATVTLKNFGRPATVLVHPLKLQQKAKDDLIASWERMHSGIDNAARTALLDGGLDVKQMAFNPEDIQMIATMQMSIIDIANFLGLAPHKLGDSSRTSYGSLEQEQQSYLDEGLDPWLCNFEAQCQGKLLTEEEKEDDSIVVEFFRRALMRADLSARANYFSKSLGGQPWQSVDEVREQEGLNPDGGDSAQLAKPLNMGGPGGPPKAPDAPKQLPATPARPGPNKPKTSRALADACRLTVTDVVGRMARRYAVHADRAAAKGGKEFVAWVDGFAEPDSDGAVAATFAPAQALIGAMGGDGRLDAWFLAQTGERWRAIADTVSAAGLVAAVKAEGESQAQGLPAIAGEQFAKAAEEAQDDSTTLNITLPSVTIHKHPPQPPAVINVAAPTVNVAPAEVTLGKTEIITPTPIVHVTTAPVTVNAPPPAAITNVVNVPESKPRTKTARKLKDGSVTITEE